jgi:hypothetical protein
LARFGGLSLFQLGLRRGFLFLIDMAVPEAIDPLPEIILDSKDRHSDLINAAALLSLLAHLNLGSTTWHREIDRAYVPALRPNAPRLAPSALAI